MGEAFIGRTRVGLGLLTVLIGACTTDSPSEPERTDRVQQAVGNGTTDTADTFRHTGALMIRNPDSDSFHGSGFLATRRFLVTVAHAFEGRKNDEFAIYFAPNPNIVSRT